MNLAGKSARVSVEHKVAATLKNNGVPYVFGMPGGGSSIDMIEACRSENIPFVLLQHETAAALMAVVCGELTNTCGISLSIMATGAANQTGGAAYAYLERHPLICITECYGPVEMPLMSLQKIDHALAFSAYCKESITLGESDADSYVDKAIQIAKSERPGPVHIDFPLDVGQSSSSSLGTSLDENNPQNLYGDLDKVIDSINSSQKPLIIVGPVALRQEAGDQILDLIDKLQAAVMVTSKARGIISEDHPLYAGIMSGVYTKGTLEERIVSKSDAVIAIGLDRMELLSPWKHKQPIITLDAIKIDENETVGQPFACASGPLPNLLRSISIGLQNRDAWSHEEVGEFWSQAMYELGAHQNQLNATSVLLHARKAAPKDSIVTAEAGVYGRVSLYAWKVYQPKTYFDSSGANTMGFSIPAALGASLVKPLQKTISLVGDSGFLMRASELETAARLNLAPIIIIFDDATLGMIRIKQRSKGYKRDGVDLAQTNFVRLAESFGGQGWEVRDLHEFDSAFKIALDSHQMSVIDVRVDPDEYASHIKPIRGI